MYRDADVGAIEAAWAARDRTALAELGTRLGIELAHPTLAQLNALLQRATGVRRRDVITTFLDAATGETGIALFAWDRWLCLAVRHEDRVTVGVARGTKVSKVWPELKPWQSHFPSNRARLEPWARAPADDRVVFVRLAAPIREQTAPPNADELVQQIVENPDDRELRAVLADLLTQYDDLRGKLMRIDAEIRALPIQSDDRKKRELVVDQLQRTHGRTLAGEIADCVSAYMFAGGFVDIVTMSATQFRDHGARVFRLQPVRRLTLQPANSAAIATLAKSNVGFLRELHVACADSRREISFAPLRDARFDRLEVLDLDGMAVVDDEHAFAELHAPQLRELHFKTHVSTATLRGLAANRVLCDRLETLFIRPSWAGSAPRIPGDNSIADDVFRALALPKLRRLVMEHCWFATQTRIAALREQAPLLTDVEIDAG